MVAHLGQALRYLPHATQSKASPFNGLWGIYLRALPALVASRTSAPTIGAPASPNSSPPMACSPLCRPGILLPHSLCHWLFLWMGTFFSMTHPLTSSRSLPKCHILSKPLSNCPPSITPGTSTHICFGFSFFFLLQHLITLPQTIKCIYNLSSVHPYLSRC